MGFMEDVAGDLDEVFFDEDFFGTWHTIDGKKVLVIVDEDESEKLKKLQRDKKWKDEVHKQSILFFVRESNMERKLTINSDVDFDGKMYFVNGIWKSDGVWKILLGRNQV